MEIKYTGQEYYDIDLAGRIERLPLAEVTPTLHIASFVLLGDTNLTNYCAKVLGDKVRDLDFDYIVCPEAKVLPLAQSLCTNHGEKEFVVFRKGVKAYMLNPIETQVKSITTKAVQNMVVDGKDAEKIKGKKVLVIDEVVSTGGTFHAMNELLNQLGCTVKGYAAVLKESDDFKADNLYYIQDLPLWIG